MSHRAGTLTALVCLVALSFGGCAYFNTFYYAKSQFKLAFPRPRDAYLVNTRLSSADLSHLTGQQSAALDSCLIRCRRMMIRYRNSRWIDDAYLLAGESYYAKDRYDDAIRTLQALVDSFPHSDLLPEGETFLGASYLAVGSTESGRGILSSVLTKYPKFGRRDLTTFLLAESFRSDKHYEDALPLYMTIVNGSRKSTVWDEAALQAGIALSKLGRFDEARSILQRIGKRKISADLRHEALVTIGETYLQQKKYPEAERAFRDIIDDVTDPFSGGQSYISEARIRIAESQNGRGHHDDALHTLQTVIDDAPHTPYAAEAQFDIGYTLEVYKSDFDGARDAYAKVRDQLATSSFTTRAESRSKNLERLRSLHVGGTQDPAAAAFAAAELLLLDLEKPQEAVVQYRLVARRFPHSEYARKAAFGVAWIDLHVLKDTTAARAEYETLLRRYPGTVYADDARYALASLGVAAPDTTPMVVDEVAVLRDSAAVADSLAPFEAAADSLARASAARDTLRARVESARRDSIARITAHQDSLDRGLIGASGTPRPHGGPPGREDVDLEEARRRGHPPGAPPGGSRTPPIPSPTDTLSDSLPNLPPEPPADTSETGGRPRP
jgi:TolA-binding protein